MNSKLRRHSGRIVPRFKGKKEILIEQGLEPLPMWNDWKDYRDGFRGAKDRKMLRNQKMPLAEYFQVKKWNKKLNLLNVRRKARQNSLKNI